MAEQENGGNADALMLNSKRQRRPSVRLGEIGDIPVTFLMDKPLKQRKKRRVAVPQPPSLPEVQPEFDPLLGDDHPLMDVDMDADVDMTGFNLDDAAGVPWDRAPRTRPLEHVSNESAAAPIVEAEPEAVEGHAAETVVEKEFEVELEAEAAVAAGDETGKKKEQTQEGEGPADGAATGERQIEEPMVEAAEEKNEEEQQRSEEENGEQQVNGVVKKVRSRTAKSKNGRRRRGNTARATAASLKARRSAADAARRGSKAAGESGASEAECNGTKEQEQEENGGGTDRQEDGGNEQDEDGSEKLEESGKQEAPRVTRAFKSISKDAECPMRSYSGRTEKQPRNSKGRFQAVQKDTKSDELEVSGEHGQQQGLPLEDQQQLEQEGKLQEQEQQQPQLENATLGDNSLLDSGDTAVLKRHTQVTEGEQHESFVLPEFVKRWLAERRLIKYSELFEFHEVDEDVLPLLTMEDLRDMGIVAIGARRKMFQAIQELG